jgi:hypothetical protein
MLYSEAENSKRRLHDDGCVTRLSKTYTMKISFSTPVMILCLLLTSPGFCCVSGELAKALYTTNLFPVVSCPHYIFYQMSRPKYHQLKHVAGKGSKERSISEKSYRITILPILQNVSAGSSFAPLSPVLIIG